MKTLVALLMVLLVAGVGRASDAVPLAPAVPIRFGVSSKGEPPARPVWVMIDLEAPESWRAAAALQSADVDDDAVVSLRDVLEALVFVRAVNDSDVLVRPRRRPAALGTVSIAAPLVVPVSLGLRSPCESAAEGPPGRMGAAIVNAPRTAGEERPLHVPEGGHRVGPSTCGGRDVPLGPATIEIPPDVCERGVFPTFSHR